MRRSCNGGITPRGCHAIQYDFVFQGVRYRPSLRRAPTEANLRRAREHLATIKERIAAGTFLFAEEFPAYRNLNDVRGAPGQRTCSLVFDAFLNHCASLQQKGGMEMITVAGYRKILDGIWRPTIGHRNFLHVTYSELVNIADSHAWSRKTYNNAISALRVAFEFMKPPGTPKANISGAKVQNVQLHCRTAPPETAADANTSTINRPTRVRRLLNT